MTTLLVAAVITSLLCRRRRESVRHPMTHLLAQDQQLANWQFATALWHLENPVDDSAAPVATEAHGRGGTPVPLAGANR